MDDMEVTYYDAHVKAHERYILLQWLEDAKTEKIKKLKEEPIATPTKKIDVPSPDITEEAISYSQVFDNPNLDVSSRLIAEKPLKVVPYMPSINPIAIPGIITNKTEVPERIGEYKITITSQMFSDIKIADIPVSNHQIPTQTTIDTNAFSGIKLGFKQERNMQVHFFIMTFVIIFGILLKISLIEWMICLILFGLVISLEYVNTAIESTVDVATTKYHPKAKIAKDTSAAAVLIAAIISVIVGLMIFMPKIFL